MILIRVKERKGERNTRENKKAQKHQTPRERTVVKILCAPVVMTGLGVVSHRSYNDSSYLKHTRMLVGTYTFTSQNHSFIFLEGGGREVGDEVGARKRENCYYYPCEGNLCGGKKWSLLSQVCWKLYARVFFFIPFSSLMSMPSTPPPTPPHIHLSSICFLIPDISRLSISKLCFTFIRPPVRLFLHLFLSF